MIRFKAKIRSAALGKLYLSVSLKHCLILAPVKLGYRKHCFLFFIRCDFITFTFKGFISEQF